MNKIGFFVTTPKNYAHKTVNDKKSNLLGALQQSNYSNIVLHALLCIKNPLLFIKIQFMKSKLVQ